MQFGERKKNIRNTYNFIGVVDVDADARIVHAHRHPTDVCDVIHMYTEWRILFET